MDSFPGSLSILSVFFVAMLPSTAAFLGPLSLDHGIGYLIGLAGITAVLLSLGMIYYFYAAQRRAREQIGVYRDDYEDMKERLKEDREAEEYDSLEEHVEAIKEAAHRINEKQREMQENYQQGILSKKDFQDYIQLTEERRANLMEELEEIEEQVED